MIDSSTALNFNLNQMSEEHFKFLFKPILKIGMDLSCLQDIKFGALLSLIQSKEDYQYIISKIKNYNSSYDRTIINHFPDITYITEKNILDYIEDNNNHKRLSYTSPTTNLYLDIHRLLTVVKANNIKSIDVGNISKRVKPDVYICCGNIVPYIVSHNPIFKKIVDIHNDINFIFISGSISDLDEKVLPHMDHMIIDNIIKFIDISNISGKLLFEKYTFYKTNILAVKQLDNTEKDEPIDVLFENTTAILDIYCNFQFIDKYIPYKE